MKREARDTWLEMNGRRGIEKGCLLVSMAIGPRTAIVNVLTVLETQNLEPNRTILFSTVSKCNLNSGPLLYVKWQHCRYLHNQILLTNQLI
jgi:hypothetical protein